MGLVPTFLGITTKQRLLHGYTCEIPLCHCRARKFSAKSTELEVNSVHFEAGENKQIVREEQRSLVRCRD